MGSFETFDYIKCYKKGNSLGHLWTYKFQRASTTNFKALAFLKLKIVGFLAIPFTDPGNVFETLPGY